MSEWVKLALRDDWGYQYYTLPGVERNDKNAVRFKVLDVITIRWPDEKVESVTVFLKDCTQRVSDWGHSSNVTSKLPFFRASLNGIFKDVPLSDVEVLRSDVEKTFS